MNVFLLVFLLLMNVIPPPINVIESPLDMVLTYRTVKGNVKSLILLALPVNSPLVPPLGPPLGQVLVIPPSKVSPVILPLSNASTVVAPLKIYVNPNVGYLQIIPLFS
jgi:hypothetical protein